MEMYNTLDKQFQTLIKADLEVCMNNNLHLVMFPIWTLNVLRGGKASKNIQLFSWSIDNSTVQVQSTNTAPGVICL